MRVLGTNAAVVVVLAMGLYMFDRSLELGDFHGLVFQLYLFYAMVIVLIVNGALAYAHARYRKEYLLACGGALLVLLALFIAGSVA